MEEHRLASSVGNNERPPSQALSPDAIGQGESDEDELVRLASKFGTILDKYSGSETDTGASIKEAIKTNKNKKHKKSYWNKVCAMEQFEPSLDESIKTIIEMTSNSKEDEAWKNHKIGHYPSEKGRTGVERVSRVRYSNGAKKYNCSGCTDETIISRMERAAEMSAYRKSDGEIIWSEFYCSCKPYEALCHGCIEDHLNDAWKSKHGGDCQPNDAGHYSVNLGATSIRCTAGCNIGKNETKNKSAWRGQANTVCKCGESRNVCVLCYYNNHYVSQFQVDTDDNTKADKKPKAK